MPVRYILSSVWVRLSLFAQLSIIQYMGLCVFSLPISLVVIERIYTLSYYHHQIGSMYHYPLFRVRSWNNGMRCMSIFLSRCSVWTQRNGSSNIIAKIASYWIWHKMFYLTFIRFRDTQLMRIDLNQYRSHCIWFWIIIRNKAICLINAHDTKNSIWLKYRE